MFIGFFLEIKLGKHLLFWEVSSLTNVGAVVGDLIAEKYARGTQKFLVTDLCFAYTEKEPYRKIFRMFRLCLQFCMPRTHIYRGLVSRPFLQLF
jgi:hypothetical protein